MATILQKVDCKIWPNKKVKFFNNSTVIFKDIELEFGMETNFGSLNSKSNIKLHPCDVIVTFSAFSLMKTSIDVIVTSNVKISQIL